MSAVLARPVATTRSGPRMPKLDSVLYAGLLISFAYMLLLDGFLRLSTGQRSIGLLRDVLPLALFVLMLLDAARRRTTRIPKLPMLGLVVAWVVLMAMQVANPYAVSVGGALQGLRPHLEFVPLFFVAAACLTSLERVRGLLVMLAVCGAINGGVSLVQSGMSPSSLASWGPGYERLLADNNPRFFTNTEGVQTVRPPALGGDASFGGILGMIALPAALAVLAIPGPRRWRFLAAFCVPWIIIAVFTSQTRAGVVGACIAFGVFAILGGGGRGGLRVMLVLLALAVGGVLAGGPLLSGITLDRYASITPTQLTSTFQEDRGGGFTLISRYAAVYPLGAGLGSAGPATSSASSVHAGRVSGENMFVFLLVEGGIPALVVMFLIFVSGVYYGTRLARRAPPALRLSFAALDAAMVTLAILWLGGPETAGTPLSPFIWTTLGCFSIWTLRMRRDARSRVAAPTVRSPAMRGPLALAPR